MIKFLRERFAILLIAFFAAPFAMTQTVVPRGSFVSGGQVLPAAPSGGTASFAKVLVGDGSVGGPSYSFTADTSTGLYRVSSGLVAYSAGGTRTFAFPTTTGSAGQFLTTDGAGGITWGTGSGVLPSQTGNSGKLLTTDGTNASWGNNITSLKLGSGTQSGMDSILGFYRNVTGTPNLDNIRDESVVQPSGDNGMFCSFDVYTTFQGATAGNHMAAFQDRVTYNGTNSLTSIWGFYSEPNIGNSGIVTNRYGVRIQDALGVGSLTNNYGIYVSSLTRGGTLNYAVYTAGITPSYFGGAVTFATASTFSSGATFTTAATLNGGASFSGGGTINGSSGSLTLAASGTNQNVTLTPSGTGGVVTSSPIAVGTLNTAAGLAVNTSSALSGTSQYGVASYATFSTSATTSGEAGYFALLTPASAFTMSNGRGIRVDSPIIGAGSAVTTMTGILVKNQGASGVTNAYGIDIEATSGAASNNISLRNAGITSLTNATDATTTSDGGVRVNGGVSVVKNIVAGGVVRLGSYTVSGLPSAATYPGGMAYVTDATATTRLSTAAGGGSNKVIVFSDGTNWLIL